MRVLLDTNVLVSAIHFDSSNPRKALERVLHGQHRLVTSPVLMTELEEVLVEVGGWEPAQAHAARLLVEDIADVVTPLNNPSICRDPDDDEVLGVADSGGVDAVVTGDKDLLALGEYANARILPPREFLEYADEVGGRATSSE